MGRAVFSVSLRDDQKQIIRKLKDFEFSAWVQKKFDEEFMSKKGVEKKIKEKQNELLLFQKRLKEMETLNQDVKIQTKEAKTKDRHTIKQKTKQAVNKIIDFYPEIHQQSSDKVLILAQEFVKNNGKNLIQFMADKGYGEVNHEEELIAQ